MREAAIIGVSVIPGLAVTRGWLRLIAEHPELASQSYESLRLSGTGRACLVSAGVGGAVAGYLCAAFMGVTFEAWMPAPPGRIRIHISAGPPGLRFPRTFCPEFRPTMTKPQV